MQWLETGGCLSLFGLLWQKYHRLNGLNSIHLFLTVLDPGKSMVKALEGSVLWVRAHFWFTGGCFLSLFSYGRGSEGAYWGLIYKGINRIRESSTLMP